MTYRHIDIWKYVDIMNICHIWYIHMSCSVEDSLWKTIPLRPGVVATPDSKKDNAKLLSVCTKVTMCAESPPHK